MFLKDCFDREVIDSAFKNISGKEAKELETHVVYAGFYYKAYQFNLHLEDRLRSLILRAMKKYKIKSVMVTSIYILRMKLITKENMQNYCTGKEAETNSINDDLELLFEDLRHGKEPDEAVQTYFLPKLTDKELELVDRKNSVYLRTLWSYNHSRFEDPDVEDAEMKASESDSKFVRGKCYRYTYRIEN